MAGRLQIANGSVAEVHDLTLTASVRGTSTTKIVDQVSFSVPAGGTLGIIGESGSGKTMTVMSLAGLLPRGINVAAGSIRLGGRDVMYLTKAEWREHRGKDVGVVFQDAMNSLDPLFTVGSQLIEAIRTVRGIAKDRARQEAVELLEEVGIPAPESRLRSYPHELSGGMAQRVAIAIAMCNEPMLLVADEPTTALDVTVQRKILALFKRLQQERGCAVIFVSHDLATVSAVADHIAVMYAGRIVESGRVQDVIQRPAHPYTLALFRSQPKLAATRQKLTAIPGTVPLPDEWPPGCRFHPRCGIGAQRSICHAQEPPMVETTARDHLSACHFWSELPHVGETLPSGVRT